MIRNPSVGMIGMLVLLAFGVGGATFAQESPRAPAEPNVTFPGPGGVTLQGYLSLPDSTEPAPGVLMIHEWWGLNRDIAELADVLAAEGYVVLAADAYRGSVGQTADEARQLATGTPGEQIAADLDASLEYLRSHDRVDAERVASLGFCFGGTQSMRLGTRNPELAAVVILYGSSPITEPDRLGVMDAAGPVLGIFGREDQNIPLEQVRAFEEALEARGVEHTITVYPGVGHAFVTSETYRNGEQAEQAWEQVVGFLDQHLKR